jgi:hypothetical protein
MAADLAPSRGAAGWTPGRIIALVAGSVLALVSLGLLGGGAALTWADAQQHGGYLTTGTATYSTTGYALASDPVRLHDGWGWVGRVIGDVRIRVTSAQPVFVAIGPASDVSRYLAGVSYTTVTAFGGHDLAQHPGTAAPAPPSAAVPWAARAQGGGTQTLRWQARGGDWMVVVLNSDRSPGVAVRATVAVSSPALPWLAGELLAAGVMAGLLAAALIIIPVRMATAPAPLPTRTGLPDAGRTVLRWADGPDGRTVLRWADGPAVGGRSCGGQTVLRWADGPARWAIPGWVFRVRGAVFIRRGCHSHAPLAA